MPSISASAGSSSTTSTLPFILAIPSRHHRRTRATMPAMNEPTPGWTSPGGDVTPPAGASYDVAGTPAWQPPPGWGQQGGDQQRRQQPQPGVVPLRPLGLGELLDGAVGLIRRYPRPVLGLSAALSIVVTVINVTLVVTAFTPLLKLNAGQLSGSGPAGTDQLDGLLGSTALGGLASSVVSVLAAIVLTGVLTAIAGRGVLGESMTLRQAWGQVRPALGRLVGLALLTGLLVYGTVGIGVVAAIALVALAGPAGALIGVPLGIAASAAAVYLYCRLALAPCATVLERAGVRQSLRRSGVLVRRSWWRVFGVLLLAFLVAAVISQVVQVPFLLFGIAPLGLRGGAGLVEGTTRLLVLTYIGGGIAQTVVAPFSAGVRALLYVDRRMRAEGLDVALAAASAQPAA